MKYIHRFNRWYDDMQPTPRFLLFMTMMSAAIFPLQIGIHFGNASLSLFGMGFLSILGLVAAVRATNMGSHHRIIGMLMVAGLVFCAVSLIVTITGK